MNSLTWWLPSALVSACHLLGSAIKALLNQQGTSFSRFAMDRIFISLFKNFNLQYQYLDAMVNEGDRDTIFAVL